MSHARAPNRGTLAVLTAVWALTVAAGTLSLWRYKSVAGDPGLTVSSWPAGTRVTRAGGRHTLVMVAHPRCPCTVASLTELEGLAHELSPAVDVHVLFVLPKGTSEGWERTPLFDKASAIPGAHVFVDRGGREAALFGAQTSGDTLLFDREGRRLFHGGITAARGHVGENAGRSRVAQLILQGTADHDSSSVYGCALNAPSPLAERTP
jgi:hypothetical protein